MHAKMRRAGNKPQTPANQCKGKLSQTGAAVEPVAAALLFMAFAGIALRWSVARQPLIADY